MRVPDFEGLKDAHEALNDSSVTVQTLSRDETTTNNATSENPAAPLHGRPESFGRAAVVLSAANVISRATPAQKNAPELSERQTSCAKGQAFYKCENGFTGCCSVNPCNPGETCPDGKGDGKEDGEAATRTGGGNGTAVGTGLKTESQNSMQKPTRTANTTVKPTTKGNHTATATGGIITTPTRRVPVPTISPAPDCPIANNRTYTDTFKIRYRIRCASDNTADSFENVSVGTGGYNQCFSSCSQSEKCAGFTYVGLDSGTCYLKAQMPNGTYEARAGNNYIACAKLDPNDNAATVVPGSVGGKSSTNAIVGGVVGGVAFLGLLLLCIALLAKRRRKKIEIKRKGTVTHVFHGPIETDMTGTNAAPLLSREGQGTNPYAYQQDFQQPQQGNGYGYAPGYGGNSGGVHARQGSTSHDVFTPYGGNVYDPRKHTRQRSYYRGTIDATGADRLAQAHQVQMHLPGNPRITSIEGSLPPAYPYPAHSEPAVIATLPASVYRVANRSEDIVALLDSTPISSPQSGGSRSPRFKEHLPEMEDTSPSSPQSPARQPSNLNARRVDSPTTDSPTLGRQADFPPQRPGSMMDKVRKKQHLMSWNNYDPSHAAEQGNEMEATMGTPKTPPLRSPRGRDVSPLD